MAKKLIDGNPYILIFVFGALIYIPFLGIVHLFDWDEINFAESAREMIISRNYLDVQINYLPFWEKPPLFIWIQVASMKLFGITEFAARFPNAVCGIVTLLVLFQTGKKFRDNRFGWIWVLAYSCSILPFFYFKSGIIDPWFNLFIFLGIVYFTYYLIKNSNRRLNLIISAIFLGLAILTKGPVAVLIFALTFAVYLFITRFRIKTTVTDAIIYILVLTLTGGFWFILQVISGNLEIIKDFIVYQVRLFTTKDAGHGGFFLYHFVVLFFGVFPASVFAVFNLFKKEEDREGQTDFSVIMQVLLFVILILFSIVSTKIVHYSSLAYFPLTFIASITVSKILEGRMHTGRMLRYLLSFLITVFGGFIIAVTFTDFVKEKIIARGWIKDGFALGNLEASGNWNLYDIIPGILFMLAGFWFVYSFANKPGRSVTGLFISTLIFAFSSMAMITPKIEAYSQRAAIEFYKSVADEDAYITTLGFKSYAHLFYGQVKPQKNKLSYEKGWILRGNLDKRAYIIFKINRKERYLREYPDLKLLSEKNGFVFAKREPHLNK